MRKPPPLLTALEHLELAARRVTALIGSDPSVLATVSTEAVQRAVTAMNDACSAVDITVLAAAATAAAYGRTPFSGA